MGERKGDWIETYSGIRFYPFDPRPEEINIVDIAHALSLTCRYNGHCKHFYSVGQHSINVCQYLERKHHPLDYQLRLAGLLHDASEAYLSDICRPLKPFMPEYQLAEGFLQAAIMGALNIQVSLKDYERVKVADDLVLHSEAFQLMKGTSGWVNKNNISVDVTKRRPRDVEAEFISLFEALYGRCSSGLSNISR